MATERAERAHLFLEQDMTTPATLACAAGQAVVFSRRCPGKATVNEDAAAVIPGGPRRAVLAVADGFGGCPAGDQASELALRALADCVADAVDNDQSLRTGILNGFEHANHAVLNLGIGAATTLAVVEIDDGTIRTYHVGDSVVLIVGQRGKLKLETISHSPIGYAVEAGLIEPTDAMHHEDRHLVSNMVGSPEMRIDIGPVLRSSPRDTILLASDGLFDNLHTDEITPLIRVGRLPQALTRLADVVDQRMAGHTPDQPCKPDDLTVLLHRRDAPRKNNH